MMANDCSHCAAPFFASVILRNSMTSRQSIILALMIVFMAAAAIGLGQWAEQVNPDGILIQAPAEKTDIGQVSGSTNTPDTTGVSDTTAAPDAAAIAEAGDSAVTETVAVTERRDAFQFGASLGLLGVGLLYCMIAAGLWLQGKSSGKPAGTFIYLVAGLAVIGLVLSYVIDDYFY